jgi:hypothetical protein
VGLANIIGADLPFIVTDAPPRPVNAGLSLEAVIDAARSVPNTEIIDPGAIEPSKLAAFLTPLISTIGIGPADTLAADAEGLAAEVTIKTTVFDNPPPTLIMAIRIAADVMIKLLDTNAPSCVVLIHELGKPEPFHSTTAP